MASFLSTAASYLGRTNISSNYTIDTSATPIYCGNWKIQRAVRNGVSGSSTPAAGSSSANLAARSASPAPGSSSSAVASSSANNPSADLGAGRGVVSVWEAKIETRGAGAGARQLMIDVLKKEAATLTRLRHPCILSVVEAVEESRYSLAFVTEPVVASLQQAIIASESAGRASNEVALDEVEIQKGLLQVARGLEFLHQAGMVHGNLDTQAVCINAKGDWKMCGFGFLTPLKQPDGTPTPHRHPDYDPSLPPSFSVNFDYLAPEYALDEKREPANDLYSLGCIVYAVHSRGDSPFRNRNSIVNLRSNAETLSTIQGSSNWSRLGNDVINVLTSLLTRYPGGRLTAQTFQRDAYFNNILVSTLKFLERESFSGRSKDERVQFLKGLLGVLPQFSDRLLRRKVLPALLELMTDRALLPFILPNVFHIAKNLSSIEFTSSVLPRLQPLFSIQDPPQNQLMLLDHMELFVSKTSPSTFREGVTPLLYSAMEAEQAIVQERALQQVPRLCEVLEYSHVKEVLFPKIAVVFSKTKILSVKVNTLISFHHMIPILDKFTLTEKLVPLLARIKTREPSVMIATLAVHEGLATKVDRETLAVHIIPQLWAMSMGPLLSSDQFEKFMKATREMGEKVAKEHMAHLKEAKRLQDHTDEYSRSQNNGSNGGDLMGNGSNGGQVDFATLVGSGKDSTSGVPRDVPATSSSGTSNFDPFAFDDLPTSSSSNRTITPSAVTPTLTPSHTGSSSMLPRPPVKTSYTGNLSSSSIGLPTLSSKPPAQQRTLSSSSRNFTSPPPPPGWSSGSTLLPSSSAKSTPSSELPPSINTMSLSTSAGGLPPLQPQTSSLGSMKPLQSQNTNTDKTNSISNPHLANQGPPGWSSSSVLQPMRKSNTGDAAAKGNAGGTKSDWGEFDPFA
ncbi:unnamed protein product [Sympodiomycopsis kandeliae]